MWAMIIKGLLLALSEVPVVAGDVEAAISEIKSGDNGAQKASVIAAHASKVVAAVGATVAAAENQNPQSKPGIQD